MKKLLISSLMGISCLAATSAMADTRLSVAFSPTSYSLDNPNAGSTAATSDYNALIWNATFAGDGMYVNLTYSTSLDDTTEHDLYSPEIAPFDRSEFSATLGFPMSDTSSVFVGIRSNTSTYSTNLDGSTLEFNASGLFAGMSFGFPMGDNSALSVSAAGALMSGELSGDYYFSGNPVNATTDSTFGYSLSASYSYFLSDDSGVGLKASYQGYDYTGWSDNTIADLTETITAVEVSYFMSF